jgi:hypothetical protein
MESRGHSVPIIKPDEVLIAVENRSHKLLNIVQIPKATGICHFLKGKIEGIFSTIKLATRKYTLRRTVTELTPET